MYAFRLPTIDAYAARLDTASGSDTPATVYALGYSSPIPGSIVTADKGKLPTVRAETETLYLKHLDAFGAVTGSPVTLTGAASGPPSPGPSAAVGGARIALHYDGAADDNYDYAAFTSLGLPDGISADLAPFAVDDGTFEIDTAVDATLLTINEPGGYLVKVLVGGFTSADAATRCDFIVEQQNGAGDPLFGNGERPEVDAAKLGGAVYRESSSVAIVSVAGQGLKLLAGAEAGDLTITASDVWVLVTRLF